ncbi:MAG: 1-acyl-sn-glycerol-3-phosphate acyltransferase [Trueperaceae bacterium]
MSDATAPRARDRVGPIGRFFRTGIRRTVRGRLRGVWARGGPDGLWTDDAPESDGFVWAANHHGWWDGFVAVVPLWDRGRTVRVLVDPDSLARFGVLRHLGGVPANRVRDAVRLLQRGGIVVIFPEGELKPAGPLGEVRPGADWLLHASGAPGWAVATRVVLRGHEAAEAYLDFAPVGDRPVGEVLAQRLADLDADLAAADPRRPLPGFRELVRGTRSWDERLAALRGRREGATS